MAKFVFKVYDYNDKDKQLAQIVTRTDELVDTVRFLNQLGIVKGFILDDDENKEIDK